MKLIETKPRFCSNKIQRIIGSLLLQLIIVVNQDNLIIGYLKSLINVVLQKNLSWRVIEFNEKSLRLTNVARM